MAKMEANIKQMEDQLKLWDAKLEVLVAKAEVAGLQAKSALGKRIDVIKSKRAAAQAKFDEFRAAGIEKWDRFQAGIEVAWKDLENAFKNN